MLPASAALLLPFCLYLIAGARGIREDLQRSEYQEEIDSWFASIDQDLHEFNAFAAKLQWDMTIGRSDEKLRLHARAIIFARTLWKNRICDSNVKQHLLSVVQKRKFYLFCRGPRFTLETAEQEIKVLNKMRSCYNTEVCFGEDQITPLERLGTKGQNLTNYPEPGDCLSGEPDLEMLMRRSDLNPDQLKWIWTSWHDSVGAAMRIVFPEVVKMQNTVARANGYSDMGEVWRDELEMPKLEETVLQLYKEIEPIYRMLHAVVRYKLLRKFGPMVIDATGSIPIHLLGNMWGQNWSPLLKLFSKQKNYLKLDERLVAKNWTVQDMVTQAADFYTSLGLPPMTNKFWKYSVFEQNENITTCHGTAANFYTGDDYRILLCAKLNMDDFYVIHHELGHIEYNMAYKHQPAVFQEGTNSAFHEAIGDVIMHGVMAPQHLHRLGLITDSELLDPEIDLHLLMQQALAKLAEIPYAMILDKYRWDIFGGKITEDTYNRAFWQMNERIRGVRPPDRRSELYFDAGAKFHVPDNTPYIRYFLSSILQMQIYKGMCELSIYGKFLDSTNSNTDEPRLNIPLHRCDIYGCKKCGRILFETMRLGASIPWTEALEKLSGKNYITTKPLLEYYEHVYEWLKNYTVEHAIPIGW